MGCAASSVAVFRSIFIAIKFTAFAALGIGKAKVTRGRSGWQNRPCLGLALLGGALATKTGLGGIAHFQHGQSSLTKSQPAAAIIGA